MRRVGIIGSAGRREDGPKMNKDLFYWMVSKAIQLTYRADHLVSGGAAWSDHVAVDLYLSRVVSGLTLYLPCGYDGSQYISNRIRDTGSIANYYHGLFSQKMGKNTLLELQEARDMGAELIVIPGGFFARNLEVGKVDLLIAFTWGEGSEPKDGGTAHTWAHSTAPRKIHIPMLET
jgi:hypothetical protein